MVKAKATSQPSSSNPRKAERQGKLSSHVALSSINDKKSFISAFPEFQNLSVGRFNVESLQLSQSDATAWLEDLGKVIVPSTSFIDMGNEHALYPLVYELLKSIVSLVDRSSEMKLVMKGGIAIDNDVEVMDAEESPKEPESAATESQSTSVYIGAESGLIDPEFKMSLERHIGSEAVKGYVEFIIQKSRKHRMVIEVKTSLKCSDFQKEKGFWQLCSEMLVCQEENETEDDIFGVLTDIEHFYFVKLSGKSFSLSERLMALIINRDELIPYRDFSLFLSYFFHALNVNTKNLQINRAFEELNAWQTKQGQAFARDALFDEHAKEQRAQLIATIEKERQESVRALVATLKAQSMLKEAVWEAAKAVNNTLTQEVFEGIWSSVD